MATPQYIKDAQNSYNAKFDLVQIKLPKGAKDRIKSIIGGDTSIAAYCKSAVISALENDENALKQADNLLLSKTENLEIKANKAPQAGTGTGKVTIAELQELIDKRKAEQDERKQRKSGNSSGVNKILDGILGGSTPEKGLAKEVSGQEDTAKSDCPF